MSSAHRQRKNRRINPVIVLSAGHIGEKPPTLYMFHHFSRLDFDQRPKGLQLEKVGVGEDLEIAAEIGIAGVRDNRSTFHKQIPLPEISSPTGRVVNASHLFFETTLRIRQLPQLNIGRAEHPASVGKIGKGPDAEGSYRPIV